MRPKPEYKLKHSPVPLWMGIAAAAAAFLFLRIPAMVIRAVVAVLVGTGSSYILGLFFPPKLIKTETKYIAPTSGVAEVDKTIKDAEGLLDSIIRSNTQIKPINGTLSKHCASCIDTSRKIMEYAAANPGKYNSMHRFFTYYLPMLDKLTKNYLLLENHSANGRSPSETKQEIENAVTKLDSEFSSLLDKLFDDTILDISTDINVLENVINDGNNINEKK